MENYFQKISDLRPLTHHSTPTPSKDYLTIQTTTPRNIYR